MILSNGANMKWFFQHPNYQLGDFIMMTPGIRAISEMNEKPVPVFFGTNYISELYRKCPFIQILPRRPSTNKAFMGTQFSSYQPTHYYKTRLHKKESMSHCYFRTHIVSNGYKKPIPNTYVDNVISKVLKREDGKKYIAVFHGCLGQEFIPMKSIPTIRLQEIIDTIIKIGHVPVILGDRQDNNRFWSKINLTNPSIINYLGNLSIGESVSILSQCDIFISNDTVKKKTRRAIFD